MSTSVCDLERIWHYSCARSEFVVQRGAAGKLSWPLCWVRCVRCCRSCPEGEPQCKLTAAAVSGACAQAICKVRARWACER